MESLPPPLRSLREQQNLLEYILGQHADLMYRTGIIDKFIRYEQRPSVAADLRNKKVLPFLQSVVSPTQQFDGIKTGAEYIALKLRQSNGEVTLVSRVILTSDWLGGERFIVTDNPLQLTEQQLADVLVMVDQIYIRREFGDLPNLDEGNWSRISEF